MVFTKFGSSAQRLSVVYYLNLNSPTVVWEFAWELVIWGTGSIPLMEVEQEESW